ncbi:MAG: zinc ABC transporter substrate-binding protein [Lachnospiraceae bacterium]|nr:zinc ABC transporter substrate-binding protein [Lachnospiraceae bacterium]
MKSKQTQKYCFVLLLSLVLIILTVLISYLSFQSEHQESNKLKVVSSFVPMYTIALNLCQDIPQVQVENLSAPKTGCLHDYEPTPADLKTISTSDVFLINGGGMEKFIDQARKTNPSLMVIDSSKGVYDPISDNAHYWLSVQAYKGQVQEVKNRLKKIFKEKDIPLQKLEENYKSYSNKLEGLMEEEQKVASAMKERGGDAVILQESFAYLARDLGVSVSGICDLDEERQVSAKEVSDMMGLLQEGDMVWADPVYGQNMQKTLCDQTGGVSVTIDPVTMVDQVEPDTYLKVMKRNLSVIGKAGSK